MLGRYDRYTLGTRGRTDGGSGVSLFAKPAPVVYRDVMLRKVADGVYWIEDADGLPTALVTALADGTSLEAAEPWWAASRRMLDLNWPE